MSPQPQQFHPSISPQQNLSLLRGFVSDYASLLKSHGNLSTAAVVNGAANHAAHELLAFLTHVMKPKKPDVNKSEAETERIPLPQDLVVEVGK
jgi:hypothetical protein